MHGHCDTRPTATFQAAGHHGQYQILLIVDRGTCWHVCKQLAQGCYLKVQGGKLNPWPLSRQYNALTITGLILSLSSTKPKCTTALCNGNILIQQYGEVCCRLTELLRSVQTSVAVFGCWSWSPGASRPLLGSLGLGHWCWSHVCGPGIDSTGLGLGPAYITGADRCRQHWSRSWSCVHHWCTDPCFVAEFSLQLGCLFRHVVDRVAQSVCVVLQHLFLVVQVSVGHHRLLVPVLQFIQLSLYQ